MIALNPELTQAAGAVATQLLAQVPKHYLTRVGLARAPSLVLPVAGAAVGGAVLVALYNPKNGKQNREWLTRQGKKAWGWAEQQLSGLQDAGQADESNAKTESRRSKTMANEPDFESAVAN